MKKLICTALALILLTTSLAACDVNINSEIKNPESSANKITNDSKNPKLLTNETTSNGDVSKTVDADIIEGEFDSATSMWYTLNDDGKSYSVCPSGLPDVVKELVIPSEYKGFPVTKIAGKFLSNSSIETITVSEGIQEIHIGFDYCTDIKNIYIPSSVTYIKEGAFNCCATMGGHGHIKSNVIKKIVVAEGNPYYHVDGNCLIETKSKKIILGCNSSVIPTDGSVKSIGYAAFANCHSIETVILPKSIIELEDYAFYNCDKLKQVYITSSASNDKKVVNFDTETVFGYSEECIFYLSDAESLEIYSKIFGAYTKFEIGTP